MLKSVFTLGGGLSDLRMSKKSSQQRDTDKLQRINASVPLNRKKKRTASEALLIHEHADISEIPTYFLLRRSLWLRYHERVRVGVMVLRERGNQTITCAS